MIRISSTSVRVLSILLVLAAAVLLVAGCGDSSDDSRTDDAPAATANEAAGESDTGADEIRDAYREDFEEIGAQLDAVGDAFIAAEDFAAFRAATQQLQATIAALNELAPPQEVAVDHQRLYGELRKALVEAKKITETSSEASDAAATSAAGVALENAGAAASSINEKLA